MTNQYPRGTDEFAAVDVSVEGVPVTAWKYLVTELGVYPAEDAVWLDPVAEGGQLGIQVVDFGPGMWQLWVKAGSSIIEGDYFVVP